MTRNSELIVIEDQIIATITCSISMFTHNLSITGTVTQLKVASLRNMLCHD